MPTPPVHPARPDDPALIPRVAAALASGRLVGLPAETLYGLAASAASRPALEALWRLRGTAPADRRPLAWHMPSREAVVREVWGDDPVPPLHKRLIDRLMPGPVLLAIDLSPERLVSIRARTGVAAGVFDDGRQLLVRVPQSLVTKAVLEATSAPVVMASIPAGARDAVSAGDALAALANASGAALAALELLMDDGRAALGVGSTLVRLNEQGGYEIGRRGAYEERYIAKQLTRTVLFICTGNTCRSPMAEAIAAHVLSTRPPTPLQTQVASAGTQAGFGVPATAEGNRALEQMGIAARPHYSTPLTRDMLREADVVYAMTRVHADAARAMDPSSAAKIHTLDPDADVPDPYGSSQEVYNRTAQVIRDAVVRRLAELG